MEELKLNEQETEWAEVLESFQISFEEVYEKRIVKLQTAGLLARSLFDRDAVPKARLKYFTEPAYNLSDTRKSHKDNFAKNRTRGEDILSHPHFLKYLKYFIYGAALPEKLKSELAELRVEIWDDKDFVAAATPILKRYFSNSGMERTSFGEETFKLCLDLGIELDNAKVLRNNVMKWR